MTLRWKVALAIAGGIVGINVALSALQSATGGSPGGPASSSYATGAHGAGAYAELLARAGHDVRRERVLPHEMTLDPGATVVVLDPPFVVTADATALRDFVNGGGRLVASDDGSGWLRRVLPNAPLSTAPGIVHARPLRRIPELAHVRRVRTAGERAWGKSKSAVPALGSGQRSILDVAAIGGGRALLLADASLLQNQLLAHDDDAQLALALAGPARRPVVFFESYHGYGTGTGLAAIPGRWRTLLALGSLAVLIFMLARVRRLGPPEDEERALDPARREYVDAIAATIARTRDRTQALETVRAEARRLIGTRAGLRPDASGDQLAGAAHRLGFADDEIGAVIRPARSDGDALAVGRALSRAGGGRRGGWRS
jgi:hypothetical protein